MNSTSRTAKKHRKSGTLNVSNLWFRIKIQQRNKLAKWKIKKANLPVYIQTTLVHVGNVYHQFDYSVGNDQELFLDASS